MGEEMAGIWDRVFTRKKNAKLLKSLQEKAQQNPQNCQAQVRLGNLLTKMGKKKAALEVYHHAAESFAQQGFIVEATALAKIIMRLDPLQREIQETVSKIYAKWVALQEEKSRMRSEPATNHAIG